MPAPSIYNVFVSHTWKRSDNSEHYRLVKMLREVPGFFWNDLSVPDFDPLGTKTTTEQHEKLKEKIRASQVVVMVSGLYYLNAELISYQADIARGFLRPMVLVRPWGTQKVPMTLIKGAGEPLGWNAPGIVAAILDRAR